VSCPPVGGMTVGGMSNRRGLLIRGMGDRRGQVTGPSLRPVVRGPIAAPPGHGYVASAKLLG